MVFQKKQEAEEKEPEAEKEPNNLTEYGFIILDREIDMLQKEIEEIRANQNQIITILNNLSAMQKVLGERLESVNNNSLFNRAPLNAVQNIPETLPQIQEVTKKHGFFG